VASVLAFSAIRNNDKVGLILFSDRVEKFIPPRKGRRHVLRVIREILFFEPEGRGTDLGHALDFLLRVAVRRTVSVVLSDFIGQPLGGGRLRQAARRHDLVAVQITDRHEMELPELGRLLLEDAETGEMLEINTGDARSRHRFAERREREQAGFLKALRAASIDAIQLRTDQPYAAALGRFFEMREQRRRHHH
jgi:uncharacterized protein (DUF58 family)